MLSGIVVQIQHHTGFHPQPHTGRDDQVVMNSYTNTYYLNLALVHDILQRTSFDRFIPEMCEWRPSTRSLHRQIGVQLDLQAKAVLSPYCAYYHAIRLLIKEARIGKLYSSSRGISNDALPWLGSRV